jgi:NAD(P)H-flavin reductase
VKLPAFTAFADAKVIRARPAALDQALIEIDPPPGFVASYARAGQFCRIRVGAVEGIFAMFSAPGDERTRFLVRVGNPDGGEAADALAVAKDGAMIDMTLPAGEGFPLERARGRDVYFVATGTGIAPVRAAIESALADRGAYGHLCLDHGLRSAGHLAIGEDIERWRAAGMEVHVHYSMPDGDGGVHGLAVQDALFDRAPNLANAAVLGVGQNEMLASLLAKVVALGGSEELFLKNI